MSFKLSMRYFSCVFLLLLLAACASAPRYSKQKSIQLSKLQSWAIKAKVAIKTPHDNLQAKLHWLKSDNNFDFHLFGPFGVTYAHLIQQDQNATLKMPEDQVFTHNNAQQLMQQVLGWDFPIDALSFWVKGLPSGRTGEKVTRNLDKQIESIKFQGWQVNFSRYQTYAGFSMPRIVKAKHPQMSLKIVINSWDFAPAE